jgi:hypothetical protein
MSVVQWWASSRDPRWLLMLPRVASLAWECGTVGPCDNVQSDIFHQFFVVSGKNKFITSIIVSQFAELNVELLTALVQGITSAAQLGESCNSPTKPLIDLFQVQDWVRSFDHRVCSVQTITIAFSGFSAHLWVLCCSIFFLPSLAWLNASITVQKLTLVFDLNGSLVRSPSFPYWY